MTEAENTLITAGTLLAGPAGEVIRDGAVLVAGEAITAVGPRTEVEPQAPPGTTTYPFPTGTVLPGLVDAHVHLAFRGGRQAVETLRAEHSDTRLALQMSHRAETLVRCGVTTARDLGDRAGLAVHVRDAIAAGEIAGPRMLAATVPLTPPGGHCWFLGGQVAGEADIRAQVRSIASTGGDAIKVMASGGESTAGPYSMWDAQFSCDELAAAVDEAHTHRLPVAAHAHASEAIIRAVQAGVDTIEHGTWLTNGDWDPHDDVAKQMAKQGTVFCHGSSNDWRRLAKVIGETRARTLVARTAWYEAHGVAQIVGTDAGIGAFTSTAASVVRYAEQGFSPSRAIEIATTAGAGALGLENTTGTLRAGLASDVLVVSGDPLDDLHALTRPLLVLAQGQAYEPAQPDRAELELT